MADTPKDIHYGFPEGTRATLTGFSEDGLVEKPAIALLESLGWSHLNLYDETFGVDGSSFRDTLRDPYLTKTLRTALARLNPGLPQDALDLAFDALTQDRASMVPMAANREVLELVRDGVDVEYRDDDGGMAKERVRVIDWRDLGANEFTLISQVWISGELHRRRTDLIGFVNGVPLLFIELKADTGESRMPIATMSATTATAFRSSFGPMASSSSPMGSTPGSALRPTPLGTPTRNGSGSTTRPSRAACRSKPRSGPPPRPSA